LRPGVGAAVRYRYRFVYDAGRGVLRVEKRPAASLRDAGAMLALEVAMNPYPGLSRVLEYFAGAYGGRLVVRGFRKFFWKLRRVAALEGRGRVALGGVRRFATAKALEGLGVDRGELVREVERLRRLVWRGLARAKPTGGLLCVAEWSWPERVVPRWLKDRALEILEYGEQRALVGVFEGSVVVWDRAEGAVAWFGFRGPCDRWSTLVGLAKKLKAVLGEEDAGDALIVVVDALTPYLEGLDFEVVMGLLDSLVPAGEEASI